MSPAIDPDRLQLYGVTHSVELARTDEARYPVLLTVASPAGEGQALLTPAEVEQVLAFLGRVPLTDDRADVTACDDCGQTTQGVSRYLDEADDKVVVLCLDCADSRWSGPYSQSG